MCLRHRGTQTLYVSNLIEPPKCENPGYGKLHVGVYIAAIQEAVDRHQQLLLSPPGDGGDLIGGDKDQDDLDHDRGSGSGCKDDHGHRGRGSQCKHGRGVTKRGRMQGSTEMNDNELIAVEVRLPEHCQPSDVYLMSTRK